MKELLGLVTHDRAPIKRYCRSSFLVLLHKLLTALILREEPVKRRAIKFFFYPLQLVLPLVGFAILLATLAASFLKGTRLQRCWREFELTAKLGYLDDRGGHFSYLLGDISRNRDYHIHLRLNRQVKK